MTAGVYFVRFADYLKIGHSSNFKRRFASLRCLAGDLPFAVIGVRLCGDLPTKEKPFAGWVPRVIEEQRMHGIFRSFQISADWFTLSDESIALVSEYAVSYEPVEQLRKSRYRGEGMLSRRNALLKRLVMTEAERQRTVEAATRAGMSFSEYVRRHGLASLATESDR